MQLIDGFTEKKKEAAAAAKNASKFLESNGGSATMQTKVITSEGSLFAKGVGTLRVPAAIG